MYQKSNRAEVICPSVIPCVGGFFSHTRVAAFVLIPDFIFILPPTHA